MSGMDNNARKIILAITGASGSIYARLLLESLCNLNDPPSEIAVVISENAKKICRHETGKDFIITEPAREYDNNDLFSPFASGSSIHDTMIICPASMGILGRIVSGTSDDLITRAADVMLKERRKLILVPREAPYNLVHIRNMETLTLAGAILCPASPSFYSKPRTIEELVRTIVDRVLSLAGFGADTYHWMGND
jgi:4-hydroxy-3-polyprenylbenzoate decarboxylase